MISSKVLYSFEALDKHSAEIDVFLNRYDYPTLFVSSSFIATWLEAFPNRNARRHRHRPYIILVYKDASLVGYCPLVLKRRGMSIVAQCAGEGLWGYSGIFLDPQFSKDIFQEICDLLGSAGVSALSIGPLYESFIKQNSAWLDLNKGFLEPLERAPAVQITEPFVSYAREKPKSTFKDSDRCERNLAKIGPYSVTKLSDEAFDNDLENLLDEYFIAHIKQWKKSRFSRNFKWKFFYKTLAQRMRGKGLAFHFLESNGQKIAFHFGFCYRQRFYYFTPTFNKEFGKFSPGKILLSHLIRYSFDNNILFDFQNGEEPYKLDYSNHVAMRYQYEVKLKKLERYGWINRALLWISI